QAGAVQVWALAGGKQAAQCWQGQQGFTLLQATKHNAGGLPVVVKAVAGAAFQAQIAQAAQRIAFGVGLPGLQCGGAVVVGVQQAALFHGKDKNHPVDQAQQLLKVGILAQAAVVQCCAQHLVVRVFDKALAEREQRLLNAVAQAVAHAGAFLLAVAAPLLPNAAACSVVPFLRGGRKIWRAAGMQQTPGAGKFAKTLALQNVLQVDFQIAGAGQAVGITQQANLAAIGGQRPQVLFAGVEQFLG